MFTSNLRLKLVGLFVVIVLLGGAGLILPPLFASPESKGKLAAQNDIAKGVLCLKQYPPLPSPPGHNYYVALLQSECGVTSKAISRPKFSKEFAQEVEAYNVVMRAEIERRFGRGVFSRLKAKAMQHYNADRQRVPAGGGPRPRG